MDKNDLKYFFDEDLDEIESEYMKEKISQYCIRIAYIVIGHFTKYKRLRNDIVDRFYNRVVDNIIYIVQNKTFVVKNKDNLEEEFERFQKFIFQSFRNMLFYILKKEVKYPEPIYFSELKKEPEFNTFSTEYFEHLALLEEIDRLDEVEKRILHMMMDGYSITDIATYFGVSRQAIYDKIRNIKKRRKKKE